MPVRGSNGWCHGRGAWRLEVSLAGRGLEAGSCRVRGLLAISLGWFLGCCGVSGEIGLVGFAGKDVMYHDKHVVIGTVNPYYAHDVLYNEKCIAMEFRQSGQVQNCGYQKGRVTAHGLRNHQISKA